MRKWDDLSMREKAEMMRVAVSNGITTLPEIKQAYNEFAEGGAMPEAQPAENIFGKGGKKDNNSKSVFLNSLEQSLREDSRFNSNEWRKFFTDLAGKESSYSPDITNSIGAKGYFQLMPFNRAKAWTNPTQQFHEMYKLTGNNLKYLQKNLTEKDWEWANKKGIDMYGMLAGAHLGGVGNVVNAIRGKGNAKDMNGSSIIGYMTKFSQNSPTRDIKLHSPYKLPEQEIPFTPWNERAFYTPLTAYQPVVLPDEQQPIVREAMAYDPKEIERQERQRGLNNFMTLMSMTSPQESGNPYLDTIGMLAGNQFKKGGRIYIKPKNRGKFTKLKERTGHSATWFKEHGTPAQKKMATFALNSRHWKHGLGGNLFSGEETTTQQMNRPNIFRYDDGRYVYQAAPNAEEIEVLPINTLLPNPSQWTYQDVSGKIYTPHAAQVDTGSIIQDEERNPLVRAANNYFREAAYRSKDGTLALQGKYTMPAIAASALLPLAGEAAYPLLTNPYVDAVATSAFAGHGLNHAINEGINGWGDAAMTALEVTPLGRLAKPAFEMGYSAVKPISDKVITSLQNNYPALFDPYTSWDATLGYHGDNIFSRVLGTVGRRHGFTPKAEVPEFHRRLAINRPSQLKLDEEGNMIISSGRTGEGHDGIVNFATSEPARGHSSHKSLSGIDDYIIDSKAIGNQDFKSIQPSDTFFETGQLAIDPKSMTLVSGNTEMLDYARSLGIRTLSSPRLRQLTASRMTKEDVINSRSEGIAKFLQNVGEIKYGKGQQNAGQIGEEMQRLTSMRGTPTMQDYSYFEGLTGLNSGVRPAEMWNGTKEQGLELFGNWGKPRRTPTFNHVAYAPASNIESIYREAKMGTRPWEDYYAALENMPSARQQLGLNSAMDTYLGEPVIPEGYLTVKPQVRTRVGDVEIDDPNLLYHLDRGNGVGAFSNQGAYVENGMLLPGIAKEGEVPYSWWNLGRPYSTSVNGHPMTRLMTATEDTPGMLHVRSQNYPIGQWNGKRGFVTNAEYVNPEGVNVSGNTYTLDPNYGWRRLFAEDASTAKWADAVKTPQITAENELAQNESLKNMFRRILRGKPDDIKITKEMAEMGRKDLLNEISSPWYKERWKKATNGNDEQIDELLSRMRDRIIDVPIDYSKTTEQLGGEPGFVTYGVTVPREPHKFNLSDGTPVTDYNTGLDVLVAANRGKEARNTAYHELQHYLTNKATGTTPYPSLKFINNGPYEPLITPLDNGELLIGRGDAWQHYIMDQNEALLPKKSLAHEEAVYYPESLKKRITELGRTPEEADNLILKLRDEAQDMMSIQEQRAHLKTWFTKNILPHLKNPNDASEIERVLNEHPSIMKNIPENIKTLMETLRPGSVKDYAKYLAESLGIIPFINKNSKAE